MPRKIPTKTKVIRYKTQNPFMRTSEIAKKMGYHRSYVHKVLKENGLFTKIPSGLRNRHVYCAECKELINDPDCLYFLNKEENKNETTCPDCDKKNSWVGKWLIFIFLFHSIRHLIVY